MSSGTLHKPLSTLVWTQLSRSFILLILRRGDAVARLRESAAKDHYTLWLVWAKNYIVWNEQRGTLVAANQEFRPAPRAERK